MKKSESKQNNKSTEELLMEISEKLDKLVGVLSIIGKTPKEQVKVLYQFDFSIEETMILTNLTENVVKKERSKLTKK